MEGEGREGSRRRRGEGGTLDGAPPAALVGVAQLAAAANDEADADADAPVGHAIDLGPCNGLSEDILMEADAWRMGLRLPRAGDPGA